MFKKIMKDERGLSLVELLAVVVIMAVIAGIGAVAITGVIQKNREDAAISSLQNVVAAANLYQASYGADPDKAIGRASGPVTAADLLSEGYVTHIGSLTADADAAKITFTLSPTDNKLRVAVEENVFTAGNKKNKPLSDQTETAIAKMTRTNFFKQ